MIETKEKEKLDFFYEVIAEDDDYRLIETPLNGGNFEYFVTYSPDDENDVLIDTWKSELDSYNGGENDLYPNYDDENMEKFERTVIRHRMRNIKPRNAFNHSYYNYNYYEPKRSTGFLDKLNKSDTLVIHCKDSTTEMLCQVYEGKNWDVLRDGNIDKNELHELIKSHDYIVCLGHGTPGGLINKQGGGYTIGEEEAPLLREKKGLFFIWCYASEFAKKHNLHGFITGNMPSDSFEAQTVGYHVSQKYMNDNITYWSLCCAKVVDIALKGNPRLAAEKAVKDYLSVYGKDNKNGTEWSSDELGITQYNADRTTAV